MKRNIIILCILVIVIIGYVIYNKIGLNSLNIKDNNEINITEEFKKFATNKNLKISNNVYDSDIMHSNNCIDDISATGNDYSLELFTFKDIESAKKEYTNQNNYQLEINNVTQVISSKSEDNYDYYEAILTPSIYNSPAATGNEHIYLFNLRIKNFYISFYEDSPNSNKENMIKIIEELKTILKIK